MCELLVDVQIESGSVAGNPNGAVSVPCSSGRVIIAATAHTGSINSTVGFAAVDLADGALSDTCSMSANGSATIYYSLTTARVATL